MAGNFVLFVGALLAARHLLGRAVVRCSISRVEAGNAGQSSPQQPNQSPPSSSHSPATVQSNVSPSTVMSQQNKVGLPAVSGGGGLHSHQQYHPQQFSYIQTKQLPSLPSSSSASTGAASEFQHHHPHHQPQMHPEPTTHQQRYLYPLPPHPDEDLSRASSVTQHFAHTVATVEDQDASPPPPPAIVEAVPRDQVAAEHHEYRTLSREDQLRASIKLKESSLI